MRDPGLLRLMIDDAEQCSARSLRLIGAAIASASNGQLASSGLARFRTNQKLLKGFGIGGLPQPALPAAAWKRWVWRVLGGLPGVRQLLDAQRRVLAAEYAHHKTIRQLHARLAMDEIARAFPQLDPPQGLANGGADDAFLWQGHTLVPAFVMYLSRAADFYTRVQVERVTSIFEIGPGFGLSSLAHLALNPGLKIIVNVDIVPVLYLSTQFLKSISNVEVVDYRMLHDRDFDSVGAGARGCAHLSACALAAFAAAGSNRFFLQFLLLPRDGMRYLLQLRGGGVEGNQGRRDAA